MNGLGSKPSGSDALSAAGQWTAGWWVHARPVVSPNFDERPAGVTIDMVVMHYISLPERQFGTGAPLDLFCNRLNPAQHPDFEPLRGLRVSSHFFIARTGEVMQLVSCLHRAWHAGVSQWRGREKCNDFSIGIELEGSSLEAFEPAQYRSLAALCDSISAQWAVSHWVGHSDIAPERKSDPGPFFDWSQLPKIAAENDRSVQK